MKSAPIHVPPCPFLGAVAQNFLQTAADVQFVRENHGARVLREPVKIMFVLHPRENALPISSLHQFCV